MLVLDNMHDTIEPDKITRDITVVNESVSNVLGCIGPAEMFSPSCFSLIGATLCISLLSITRKGHVPRVPVAVLFWKLGSRNCSCIPPGWLALADGDGDGDGGGGGGGGEVVMVVVVVMVMGVGKVHKYKCKSDDDSVHRAAQNWNLCFLRHNFWQGSCVVVVAVVQSNAFYCCDLSWACNCV